ncbi:MAG: Mrp/NBP35 family ATP-binding protein [Hyphococcus sp.]
MTEPLTLKVRNALARVVNPATGRNIIAEGAVQGLHADSAGKVRFALQIEGGDARGHEAVLAEARAAAAAVDGVASVSAVATAHRKAAPPPPAPSAGSSSGPALGMGGHDNPLGMKKRPRIEEAAETLSGVKTVIAVASGKGGVGKSTLAANLAVALARRGLRTGLLDADIYGPSLPTLFGLGGKAAVKDGKVVPFEAHGVRAMSIGLIVDPDKALAWRGPMVMGALRQLMSDVDWGTLDVLLVDTPPGTGDAHLSLIQSKRLSGAVIVSTPQEMALADVRRGVQLFRKTDIPIIGVVENMAWIETPDGSRQHLFGEGGAARAAQALDAPFLGAIPLYPALREASDAGTPLAATDHPAAEVFARLAEKVAAFAERTATEQPSDR